MTPESPLAERQRTLLNAQIAELEAVLKRRSRTRIDYIFPDAGPCRRELYPRHLEFIAAGAQYRERGFVGANRCGKTMLAAFEMSCHLTGKYPAWWNGRKFSHPIQAWAAGTTNQTTRDIVQANLLGPIGEEGTGLIPGDDIISTVNRSGIPGAIDTAIVQHVSGGRSSLTFKSFEQGRKSFEGTSRHLIWLDEEPPLEVYTENLLRLATTKGMVMMTFTPLQGWSDVVKSYMEPVDGAKRYWVQAGWDDCPHLDEDTKRELLASIPPHQREARTKGTPSLGSGAIYPVAESDIVVSPFRIPDHWPRAYGMDVGWNRTAVVWGAKDPEDGVIYLYSEHYVGSEKPPMHADAIKARGAWIPGVIDPASNGRSQEDGGQLLKTYRALGLNLMPADNSVETGIYEVWTLLSSGMLKFFSSLSNGLAEFRKYRRDEKGIFVFTNELNRQLEGIVVLACVGVTSIVLAIVVGLPLVLIWLWNHVTVSIH